MTAKGYFALVLHAHLPFVRHPEDPTVMEERWLYEAITGTYLPLIQMFEGLVADGVPFRCTVSLSAPLITMLTDDLLRSRYAEHVDEMIALADKEIQRTEKEEFYQRVAQMYRDRFRSLRHTWRCHEGNLVRAFRRLQDAGQLEVLTSTATHAFFPLLDRNPAVLRAQVHAAAELYERHFDRRPSGMWLGECGFVPGVDELLREAALRYFIVDSHAVLHADSSPVYGVHAPVFCPSGVAAFPRDPDSSEQMWSAQDGYPGDPHYRDFYRDIGFDLPLDYIAPHVHPEGHRLSTAAHFRGDLAQRVEGLAAEMDRPPLVVSPYDAELFGHWWYEGPIFLGDVFRQLHHDQDVVETITPGDYLERHPTNQQATPSLSSWGLAGFSEQWLNETNAWTWPHVHMAGERMTELAHRYRDAEDPLTLRALNQAARELMLAQSSDWAFIMSTGTTVPYATRRFNEHIARFNRLYEQLSAGEVNEELVSDLESRDNIFPDIDYRIYAN